MKQITRVLLVGPVVLLFGACQSTDVPTMEPDPTTLANRLKTAGFDLASVSAGARHSCGLTRAGRAYCWGSNPSGALGDASYVDRPLPVPVAGGLTFVSVSAGGDFSCGLVKGGKAYCWGSNFAGQLGDGSTYFSSNVPVAVVGGLAFSTVIAADRFACGLTRSGTAYCWGFNAFSGLGNGTNTDSPVPVAVAGGLTFASLSSNGHSCGLTTAGQAYCWGYNYYGELGIGTSGANSDSNVPVAVAGGLTFVAISAGQTHTCALVKGGAAYCWGDPNTLGTASPGAGSVPVAVDGGLTFTSLSAGGHSCGLAKGGQAYCWGYNFAGEIGDGTTVARPTPVPVAGALSLSTVTAGGGHTCALTLNSGAWCWGENSDGQLGNGDVGIDRSAPTPVATP